MASGSFEISSVDIYSLKDNENRCIGPGEELGVKLWYKNNTGRTVKNIQVYFSCIVNDGNETLQFSLTGIVNYGVYIKNHEEGQNSFSINSLSIDTKPDLTFGWDSLYKPTGIDVDYNNIFDYLQSKGERSTSTISTTVYVRLSNNEELLAEGPPISNHTVIDKRVYPRIENFNVIRCKSDGEVFDEGSALLLSLKVGFNDSSHSDKFRIIIYQYDKDMLRVNESVEYSANSAAVRGYIAGVENRFFDNFTMDSSLTYKLVVVFTDGPETARAIILSPKAFANLHLSASQNGGVAMGMFSTATENEPKFECDYNAYFYKSIFIHDGEDEYGRIVWKPITSGGSGGGGSSSIDHASDSVYGTVKVGNNINVSNGVISLNYASQYTYGVVKLASNSGLQISNGELSLASGSGSVSGIEYESANSGDLLPLGYLTINSVEHTIGVPASWFSGDSSTSVNVNLSMKTISIGNTTFTLGNNISIINGGSSQATSNYIVNSVASSGGGSSLFSYAIEPLSIFTNAEGEKGLKLLYSDGLTEKYLSGNNYLTVRLKDNSGISCDRQGLFVKLKSNGGISCDSNGLYVQSVGIESAEPNKIGGVYFAKGSYKITEKISSGGIKDCSINFSSNFTSTPNIYVSFNTTETSSGFGRVVYSINNVTTSGFTMRVHNGSSSSINANTLTLDWIAIA